MQNSKINAVDGIRGLALLNVLILHATGLFFPSIGAYLSGTAQFGVWLFFILSAFLLTNRFFVTGFSPKTLLSYFLGRSLRIMPIFFLAVYVYFYAGLFDESVLTSIVNFTGTYAHFWTIPVEFSFYFVLPFIAYAAIRVTRLYGPYVAFAVILSAVVIHQLFFPHTRINLGGRMIWYVPVFLFGMMVSCLFMSGKRATLTPMASDAICLLVFIVCFCTTPYVLHNVFGMPLKGWISNKFTFISPLLAVFVYLMCEGKGVFGWLMRTTLMTSLGKWSFSIYLWHLLILFRIAPFNHNNVAVYVVTIIACVGLGAISFKVIEEPCEKLRHKLMNGLTGRQFLLVQR